MMAEFDGDTPVASSTQNRLACDIKILGPPFVITTTSHNIFALCVGRRSTRRGKLQTLHYGLVLMVTMRHFMQGGRGVNSTYEDMEDEKIDPTQSHGLRTLAAIASQTSARVQPLLTQDLLYLILY